MKEILANCMRGIKTTNYRTISEIIWDNEAKYILETINKIESLKKIVPKLKNVNWLKVFDGVVENIIEMKDSPVSVEFLDHELKIPPETVDEDVLSSIRNEGVSFLNSIEGFRFMMDNYEKFKQGLLLPGWKPFLDFANSDISEKLANISDSSNWASIFYENCFFFFFKNNEKDKTCCISEREKLRY